MKVVVQKGWIFQFLPQSGQLVYYVGWAWSPVRATAPPQVLGSRWRREGEPRPQGADMAASCLSEMRVKVRAGGYLPSGEAGGATEKGRFESCFQF